MKRFSVALLSAVFLLTPISAASAQQNADCISFNPDNAEIRHDGGGRWLLADDNHRMVVFPNHSEAARALSIIQHYGMNEQCFIGRPDPSLTYWLVDGERPSGSFPGEDCIVHNTSNLSVEQESADQWLLTDGASRMRVFPNGREARQTRRLFRQMGFTRTCYVGRPGPSMTYLR